jgi:hypothetical protein
MNRPSRQLRFFSAHRLAINYAVHFKHAEQDTVFAEFFNKTHLVGV